MNMDNQTLHSLIIRVLQTSKNGFIYGSRLRFAHSLVISLLFKPNLPLNKRLKQVSLNTLKHGELLFTYAFIYKSLLLNLYKFPKIATVKGLSEFISGFIGGMLIYSGLISRYDSNIAHQITLYCGSRVMLGVGKRLARSMATDRATSTINTRRQHQIENMSWALYSALIWGGVMCLYKADNKVLQRSLTYSMDYIYNNDQSRQLTHMFRYIKKKLDV